MDPTIPFPKKAKSYVEQVREERERMSAPVRKHDTSAMTHEQARALLCSVCNAADAKFQEIKRLTDELIESGRETEQLTQDMLRHGHIELNTAYVTIAGIVMYYVEGASGQAKVMTLPNGSA